MRARVIAGLLAASVLGGVTTVAAQDPTVDLPWRRAKGSFEPVWSALSSLKTGWNWEAARMARELLARDEDRALPYLLLAIATRDEPNRAARYCWEAVQRRDQTTNSERMLVGLYQQYFGVKEQPELVDERFASPPDESAQKRLVQMLAGLRKVHRAAASHGDRLPAGWRDVATELHALEQARLQKMAGEESAKVAVTPALLTAHATYLHTRSAMPFLLPGYARLLADSGAGPAALARLPKHPQHPQQISDPIVAAFPALYAMQAAVPDAAVPDTAGGQRKVWQPRRAPGFDLARGVGGQAKYADYAGKPVLVVFFLGFGCAHCVAQLKDLDPRAPKFRAAGIEVVSIGTDDVNQVRAARQAAQENGVDPLHFDVLCDPKGQAFRQWGVWDEFDDEALHGTFLVDGKGRILWQDVSKRPFEQSDWLLAESRRLLKAWR